MYCTICAPPGGHCTDDPRQCSMFNHMQRIEAMEKTTFYCPECNQAGIRADLFSDGEKFHCKRCEEAFTKDQLIEAYASELEKLEADALFVKRYMLNPLTEAAA